ncbi:glycosyl transferase/ family 1 [Synechococcus sp. A18-25c]|uniref:glycosyl transferase family 1 n=1 Tax=Synechococcus sp. A18-25c TaxID=1866938 RepID=UPI001646559B|nr:glycosyl transferase family 1 [Synechococcus sp. A18-25c]QNJ18447.1 glycosyl transferase/ family 1 [Synechococcus sp. A18-25c]
MDILFIHGNYPAQFKHLAAALGASRENSVVFLTGRQDAATQPIQGVTIRCFKLHRSAHPSTHHYLTATEESILKGQAVIREINSLLEEGFDPKLVITHGGVGLGLFIKDLLPKTIHIGLFEWYFKKATAKWLLNNYGLDEQLKTRMRNLNILEELSSCDAGVVPTAWQHQQFPKEFQNKLSVIFDGIDTDFFHPYNEVDIQTIQITGEELDKPLVITPDMVILSYATRGMETLRGFPEFLRSASKALQKIENLHVVIAGRDRRAYSYDAPTHEGSWKKYILAEMGNFKGLERLHFTGLLPYPQYRMVLQRSNLHCYFTRPYVTSWSLFEAAACGARLCVNETEATEGIVKNQSDVTWIDLDNPQAIEKTMVSRLRKRSQQRCEIRQEFSVTNSLKKWEALINNLLKINIA